MDPNAALRTILELVAHIRANADKPFADLTEEAENLANAFSDLHDWIQKGGTLPESWDRKRATLDGLCVTLMRWEDDDRLGVVINSEGVGPMDRLAPDNVPRIRLTVDDSDEILDAAGQWRREE